MTRINVLALQPNLQGLAPETNVLAIRRLVDATLSAGEVDLIVLPEVFDGSTPSSDADLDEAVAGSCWSFVADLAAKAGAIVVGGSVARRSSAGALHNVCLIADRQGKLVGEYAKRMLFATELDSRTPGEAAAIVEVEGVRIGVLICADLWFPELARELSGWIDVLCVPAKTIVAGAEHVSYARTLWWSMAMTRSAENAMPVVVADWCQSEHEMGMTAGASSINDPARRPDVARMQLRLEDGRQGVLRAEVDLDAIREIRQYRQAMGLLAGDDPGDAIV